MKSKKEKAIESQSIDKLLREWKSDIVEDIIIDVPDYSYGSSQEPLDANFQVRNINSWWGKINSWYDWWVPSWYVDYSITWVWFKPKAIEVKIIPYTWNIAVWGTATNNWTIKQSCIYSNAWSFSYDNNRLFRFSGTDVWTLVSFDSDWFTIKSDLDCRIIWTCFW